MAFVSPVEESENKKMTQGPRVGHSYAAFKNFATASSYFTYFYGTYSEMDIVGIDEVKRVLGNPSYHFMNSFLSLYNTNNAENSEMTQDATQDDNTTVTAIAADETDGGDPAPTPRSYLEYLPFINPLLRSFHPNLILNEENNEEPPPSDLPHAYKTVMCEAWLINAYCGYGKSCRFAHGLQELRPSEVEIRDTTKYQTKVCLKYTTNGICPHGFSCLFYHPLPQNPQVLVDAVLTAEKGISPEMVEASNEYYMMSRSFYMDAQSFENPYIDAAAPVQLEAEEITSNEGDTKVLDLVFDGHQFVTSQSTSDITKPE